MIAAAAMALTVPTATLAQGAGEPAGRYMKMRWTRMAAEVSDSFLTTAEAARIGDNLLFYQHPTGGWPKNMQLQDTLTGKIRDEIAELKGQERYANKIPRQAVWRHGRQALRPGRGAGNRLFA